MPSHPVVVSGAIIIVSAAVAAAIAVYESPQVRQYAEDVRRRIALALHSLGDEINPNPRQPRFNRPEDADGFLVSSGNAEVGVDADEESKRRQREELMYWNAVHLEKMEKERKLAAAGRPTPSRGSSFDDFLQQDHTAEQGTYVYNSGADVHHEDGLRNRRIQSGVSGFNRGSLYANPFADENNIDTDEQRATDRSFMAPDTPVSQASSGRTQSYGEPNLDHPDYIEQLRILEAQNQRRRLIAADEDSAMINPRGIVNPSDKYEVMSDLYSANDPKPTRETTATFGELLIDTSEPVPDPPVSYPSMEEHMEESRNYTNMGAREDNAYASIHAWADNTNNAFYSPLPVTPRASSPQPIQQVTGSPVFSDPPISVPGSGEATPTDSASLAGSGDEVWAPRSGATSEGDVMSVDGEGINTPGSWTEVGSVVSENDVGAAVHN